MAPAAINFIIIGESSTCTADFLLLPDGVTAGSLQAYAIFFFYSLPSERANSFFSSLGSTFNPSRAVSPREIVIGCVSSHRALGAPKQEWLPSSVVCSGMGVTSLTHRVTGVQRHSKPQIAPSHCSRSSIPACGLCVRPRGEVPPQWIFSLGPFLREENSQQDEQ